MRNLAFALLVLAFAPFCKAQPFALDLKLESRNVYGGAHQTQLKAVGYILNNSGKKATIFWEIAKGNLPVGWKINVSDANTNYPESTTSGSVAIENGDSARIEINLNPSMAGGTGVVTISVSDQADPFDIVEDKVTFHIAALNVAHISEPSPDLQFFPNPATSSLKLKNAITQPVDVEIFNAEGKLQLSKTLTPQMPEISIATLPTGIYIVRYQNSNGNIVTQKIHKTATN